MENENKKEPYFNEKEKNTFYSILLILFFGCLFCLAVFWSPMFMKSALKYSYEESVKEAEMQNAENKASGHGFIIDTDSIKHTDSNTGETVYDKETYENENNP